MKIDFNPVVIGKLTKSQFKKRFEKVYPNADLDEAYDRIVPKKVKKSESEN